MVPTVPSSLESFHSFVAKELASSPRTPISPEEAVAMWRREQAALAAIREGLEDITQGRTQTLDEFRNDFVERHGIEGAR